MNIQRTGGEALVRTTQDDTFGELGECSKRGQANLFEAPAEHLDIDSPKRFEEGMVPRVIRSIRRV